MRQGNSVGTPVSPPERGPEGLTSIPRRIHWPATDAGHGEYSEADTVIIQDFIETLAEVAMAVAAPRGKQRQHEQA